VERVLARAHDHDETRDADPRLRLVTSSCSSPTASGSDNAKANVVDLPGSTVPAGYSLPPLALSKILDTWRPPCVALTSG
jgi:hypothetical protein